MGGISKAVWSNPDGPGTCFFSPEKKIVLPLPDASVMSHISSVGQYPVGITAPRKNKL